MTSKWRAWVLLAGAVPLAVACGKRSSSGGGAIVARVGDRVITRSYYEDRLAKMDRKFLPDTLDLAGKRRFLDFIINKEVMAKKAEELQYDADPQIAKTIQTLEDGLTLNTAVDKICEGKLEASEQEIQDFFDKQKTEVVVKHILVKDRELATELQKRLQGGAEFDSLASQYSTVPRQDVNTGEALAVAQRVSFGPVRYGDAMLPVEQAVFALQEGQVSPPVQTAYGWHLFKAVERNEVRRGEIGEAHDRIATQIKLRKKRVLVEAYYEGILRDHRFKWDEQAASLVYDRLPPDVGPENRPDPATEVKPVLPFKEEERQRVFFEIDGKKHTLADFSDRYDATSWFERPKRNAGAMGLRYWVRDRWLRDRQLERARKNHVHELPQVANEVKLRREQIMVGMLHENLVAGQAPEPTEAQIQEFFDKHKDTYVMQEMRRASLVFSPQEKVVRRAYDEIARGADFVATAVKYNERATEPKDVQTQDFGRDAPEFAEIAPKVFALQLGQHTEPFKTSQGWVILQVAHIEAARPFALLEIKDQVIQDYKNQWSEDKLNELLAEWKKGIKVDVDDKALAGTEVKRTDVVVPGVAAAPGSAGAPGAQTTPGTSP